jgi:hypothetical protein
MYVCCSKPLLQNDGKGSPRLEGVFFLEAIRAGRDEGNARGLDDLPPHETSVLDRKTQHVLTAVGLRLAVKEGATVLVPTIFPPFIFIMTASELVSVSLRSHQPNSEIGCANVGYGEQYYQDRENNGPFLELGFVLVSSELLLHDGMEPLCDALNAGMPRECVYLSDLSFYSVRLGHTLLVYQLLAPTNLVAVCVHM